VRVPQTITRPFESGSFSPEKTKRAYVMTRVS
jgi:hypothetical protein